MEFEFPPGLEIWTTVQLRMSFDLTWTFPESWVFDQTYCYQGQWYPGLWDSVTETSVRNVSTADIWVSYNFWERDPATVLSVINRLGGDQKGMHGWVCYGIIY